MNSDPWNTFAERLSREEPAALEVFSQLSRRLVGLIQRNLDRRLARRLDAEDVLQSVLRSFIRGQLSGQLVLRSADDLWGLLVVIAVRKCARKHEQHFAERRDVRRELAPSDLPHSGQSLAHVLGREPSPSEAASLAETVERLFAQLNPQERKVMTHALAGQTVEEISHELGRTQRTVRRILAQIRARLETSP